jgi:lysophospholipase L1-like esterase
MTGFRRRTALVVTAALATLTGAFAVAVMANAAAAGCRVDYRVTNQWQGGFGGDVTITNVGDPITAWTLSWTFASGQTVVQAWNATVTQSAAVVTAKNVSYNGAIPGGGTANFGFNGSWTTANPIPSTFTLNGVTCTGGVVVTPCPPPPTTAPPMTAPPTSRPPTTAPPATTSPPAQARVTIWMAGDSTMQNASTCPIGWGSQFAPNFNSNVTVVNSAVGGRSIQTWLYDPNVTTTKNSAGECVVSPATFSDRWQAMLNSSTGMKAGDYLFIQFGINDGDSTCNRHVGSARYEELLGMMATAAKQRGAKPIFLTPVAAITCSGSVAVGNRGFLTETFDAGTASGVPVIDLHKLSYTLYNTLKLCPNNGDFTMGAVGAFFCNDHTHFEAAGARQIATVVATALRNQQIPLAAYLR